jgi:[acyl-carrier-protein] S-malonyltransferase
MQPAADAMAQALGEPHISAPSVPVVVNVRAAPETDPDVLRARLVEQVTGTVRWRESMEFMVGEGVGRVYEAGAGKVLSGLARRIARDLDTAAIGTAKDIAAVGPTLRSQQA